MKLLAKDESLCIGCGECEAVCSKTYFKEISPEKSCIRVGDQKIQVCTQCGECIDVCSVAAISRDKNGVVRINKKLCVGCFMCVGFCPELAMKMHGDLLEPFKCIACGQCAKICPTHAIHISEEA
ncbi:MAG TPA: aldehyde:ferredoxin oxidoreductase [Desulfosporosinus sp.]|nr:aldehyde:ferredoxin oxidoreductase [Desulfosporosinus sp.]